MHSVLLAVNMKQEYISRAKSVLENNFRDPGFTLPSEGLYPFQWNWDSGLIAIGYANYDIEKAKTELRTLLDAQWPNGFIPHIIYHGHSNTYFPGPEFHQAWLSQSSLGKYKSTGMIQPPVIAFVLMELYKKAKDKQDILEFISEVIDKVFLNHQYLYTKRDPFDEGLVYIFHNWESGTDNSPIWDEIFNTFEAPKYNFKRRDTSQVEASERPSNREYDYYLYLIDLAKENKYDEDSIASTSPFLVQDPLLNALLIKSNGALIDLYKICGFGEDKISMIQKWQAKSISSYNEKFFDDSLGVYVHYDLRNERKIRMLTSSSFAAIYAGIPDQSRTKRMVSVLKEKFGGKDRYLCASFDPNSEKHDPKRYWRGPVWINLNWMLYHGLMDYGYQELSEQIKGDSIELVEKYGFYEYFDPRRNARELNEKGGYGGSNFSWTAALYLDFVLNNGN